jgi:hypothetical protein
MDAVELAVEIETRETTHRREQKHLRALLKCVLQAEQGEPEDIDEEDAER